RRRSRARTRCSSRRPTRMASARRSPCRSSSAKGANWRHPRGGGRTVAASHSLSALLKRAGDEAVGRRRDREARVLQDAPRRDRAPGTARTRRGRDAAERIVETVVAVSLTAVPALARRDRRPRPVAPREIERWADRPAVDEHAPPAVATRELEHRDLVAVP